MKPSEFIVFKDHLVPNIFKGQIYSVKRWYMHKNNITSQVANPLLYHLDKSQYKKLNKQLKKFQIESKKQINNEIQKYLAPLQNCPQYFPMLLNQTKKNNSQQYQKLNLHQISQNYRYESMQIANRINSKMMKAALSTHPAKKRMIYNQFKEAYTNYKSLNKELLHLLAQSKIFYIPPLLYTMPIQLFQVQNPDLDLATSIKIYTSDKNIERNYKFELHQYIVSHKKIFQYICIKTGLSIKELFKLYQTQLDRQNQIKMYIH